MQPYYTEGRRYLTIHFMLILGTLTATVELFLPHQFGLLQQLVRATLATKEEGNYFLDCTDKLWKKYFRRAQPIRVNEPKLESTRLARTIRIGIISLFSRFLTCRLIIHRIPEKVALIQKVGVTVLRHSIDPPFAHHVHHPIHLSPIPIILDILLSLTRIQDIRRRVLHILVTFTPTAFTEVRRQRHPWTELAKNHDRQYRHKSNMLLSLLLLVHLSMRYSLENSWLIAVSFYHHS